MKTVRRSVVVDHEGGHIFVGADKRVGDIQRVLDDHGIHYLSDRYTDCTVKQLNIIDCDTSEIVQVFESVGWFVVSMNEPVNTICGT